VALANESNRLRALVVDDDRNCRELLGLILKEMGCDVTSASSGYEALQQINETPFDLVFTDLSMTVMDGWRLAQNI